MKKNNLMTLCCLLLLLSGFGATAQTNVQDLIQPLSLIAGKTVTVPVSDLFYAETYPLEFRENEAVSVQYDSTGMLTLTPNADAEGLTLLTFHIFGQQMAIPVSIAREVTHRFVYRPAEKPEKVTVFGSFNAWNRNELPLTDEDGDGTYQITIPLEPGRYEYKFFVDGREVLDPQNPDSISNPFGSYNSLLTIPPRYPDAAYLHIIGMDSTVGNARIHFFYQRENQPGKIAVKNVVALLDNTPLTESRITVSGNAISVALNDSLLNRFQTLRITVTQNGQTTPFQQIWLSDLSRQPAPFVWNDAILYALMVDRFYDGDSSNNHPVQHPELLPQANFMGGDLQGVLAKLEAGYFDSLHVNTLWISPINQNTTKAHREYPPPHRYFSAYHGYWPVDHQQVDFRFGDMAVFKKLVDTAHRHDKRVLLDFVSNHTHEDHPFYRQHRDWFGSYELPDGRKNIRLWDEYRLTTWFEPFLPSFDYLKSQAALDTMTNNAVWWLAVSGIDGFRQDAVKHVPNRFWRTLTRKINQRIQPHRNTPVFQIGETFGSYDLIKSFVNPGQLNSQFNFNLYFTARHVFLTPEASFADLRNELDKTHDVYGMFHQMGNLMDSHDQVRYMAFADGDLALDSPDAAEIGWENPPQVDDTSSYQKARLYLAYMFTIPGIPTLYYGDEIGMTGAADPDNRRMMRFGNNLSNAEKQMLKKVRRLTELRNRHIALRRGDFYPIVAEKDVMVYLRNHINERILVVLNKGLADRQLTVALPEFYRISGATDCLSKEKVEVSESRLTITVPATGYRIIELY